MIDKVANTKCMLCGVNDPNAVHVQTTAFYPSITLCKKCAKQVKESIK